MIRSNEARQALELERDGARFCPAALTKQELIRVEHAFEARDADKPGARLFSGLEGLRGLFGSEGSLGRLAAAEHGPKSRPVRVLLFNKRPGMNWALGLHQDRTIAVVERRNADGFDSWSVKDGHLHVQPPQSIIDQMLTLRVHLDDVDTDAAPLFVLPGSHRLGRLSEADIEALAAGTEPAVCTACRGDVWIYATAIVHGSDAIRAPQGQRRVLQVDYAAVDLPSGLEWALRL